MRIRFYLLLSAITISGILLLYLSCNYKEATKHRYSIYAEGYLSPLETDSITISDGCVSFIPYNEKHKKTICRTFEIRENL